MRTPVNLIISCNSTGSSGTETRISNDFANKSTRDQSNSRSEIKSAPLLVKWNVEIRDYAITVNSVGARRTVNENYAYGKIRGTCGRIKTIYYDSTISIIAHVT